MYNYFDLSISKDEKIKKYERDDNGNIEFQKKMDFKYLESIFSNKKIAFLSITLSRAILKCSFVGIYFLIKKYYNELDGEAFLINYNPLGFEKLIFSLPSIGLLIGAGLSFINWFKENKTILIISFLIGISGTLACFSNKFYFEILIMTFYVLANLIIPSLIQKSFDCFKDEQQLHEISYTFNCLIYLFIGNLISSILNTIFGYQTKFLMKMYLLIVWANFFLIYKYKSEMEKESHAAQKNSHKLSKPQQLVDILVKE